MGKVFKRLPSPSMAVAFVALLAALTGTAVALPGSNTVTSGDIKNSQVKTQDIKNSTVAGKDVKNNTLKGADVDESSLGTVPSAGTANNANTAGNANTLNGKTDSQFLQDAGCETGKILGFARIKGTEAGFPAAYTNSSDFVDITNNCAGGTVEVRRASAGRYFIRFVGNPAFLGLVSVNNIASTDNDNIVSSNKVVGGADNLAFEVQVEDSNPAGTGSVPQNGNVTIVLP